MSKQDLGQKVPGADNTYAKTLSQGADMEVQRVTILNGGNIPLHSHPFGQSYVVIAGEGAIVTPSGKSAVGPGAAGYFKPEEPHGWESEGGELVFVSSSASEDGIYEANEVSGGKWNIHYHS
ncbi:cupin domain-containing protein [Aureisphaera galaxeae]|uniref:cupin domain-containing protein n=1 Tax=Aureisphaera galaxeae TaxID=1538023 RepID=UPI0023500362|nr:cupin domain-containing protein [Aureisphaera galaxeae]MDC8004292.1 cupin domain-containing protein [Aureisphaera galaxeae]